MLGKEEAKALKLEFFEALKTKMQKHKSSGGFRVNWMNYPLQIKNYYCRIVLEDHAYGLVIDYQEKDESMRQLYAEQWSEVKKALENVMEQEVSISANHTMFTGVPALRVTLFWEEQRWSDRTKWPEIHKNLKDNLLRFDVFWQDFGELFITLAD